MKNIYFIEAKSPGAHIFSFTTLPRLGSILLGTILKNHGYNVKVFIEDIAVPNWKSLEDADLICISSITSTALRAFQLAERFRRNNIPIAIGGPHSTFLPEESLSYADYVVRGEGEETLLELIKNLETGLPLNTIKGLSYRSPSGHAIHNPARELIRDLNDSPTPDFSLVYKWENASVIPVATSRGCPYDCKFCSVIPMFGRKYRFKTIERVLAEIEASAPSKGHVFFIDDNFAANKKRTKQLLKAMIEQGIRFEWSAQVRTDVAKDPELLDLMEKSGCFSVFIGFESINPKTLSLYNKSQGLEDIENAIRLLKKHSIHIHGMFVLGSDTDDIRTIRETAKFAKKLDIDSIQFMVLTPLPGTAVYRELEESERLIHTDWGKYDAHHAVFEPKLMTAFELHVETLKAMARFYSWSTILRNLWTFDFFYAVVGIYGKRSVKDALSRTKAYLTNLGDLMTEEFDKKTEKIRQVFPHTGSQKKSIILNTAEMEQSEFQFFSTFLSKLDKKIVIYREELSTRQNTLAITPLVHNIKNRHEMKKQQLASFYEKHKDRLDSVKIVNMESISLYKSCVNIGLLLNANTKKIRKAYDKALKSCGGKVFECNLVLIMVQQ